MTLQLKSHYSIQELVGLPGLPGTVRGVLKRATVIDQWPARERRTGLVGPPTREYPFEVLPEITQQAIIGRAVIQPESAEAQTALVVAEAPQVPEKLAKKPPPTLETLRDWQREQMEARLVVLAELERMEADFGSGSALDKMVLGSQQATLPEAVMRAIPRCHGQDSTILTLSRRTLQRWRLMAKQGQIAVSPQARPELVPGWIGLFLRLYRRPSNPSIPQVIREMAKLGKATPTEQLARWYLKERIGVVTRQRGRVSRRQILAVTPFIRRDTSMLWPMDVINGDGHSFYSFIQHPETGQPWCPEVTEIFDVATRCHVGYSIGSSENHYTVLDAIRMAIENFGVPAVVQWDNGSGMKNNSMHDAVTGMAARLGFEIYHQRPNTPQAGGIVERGHQSVVIAAAKIHFGATFIGRRAKNDGLDRIVKKKIAEGTVKLPVLADLVTAMEVERHRYNHAPHSALPMISDGQGKRRHQSPIEAWETALAEGWTPWKLEKDELADEFRPEEVRVVRRGEIQIFKMRYFSHDLTEHHGKQVRVRYDIRDGKKVWIRDMEGSFLAEAIRDGNVKPYLGGFEGSNALEHGKERRFQKQENRRKLQIEKARAEAGKTIELQSHDLTPEQIEVADRQIEQMQATEKAVQATNDTYQQAIDKGQRPETFPDNESWGLWVMEHYDECEPDEQERWNQKMQETNFRLLLGIRDDLKRAAG